MNCAIRGCNAKMDIKMFHYSFDEELHDYICNGTIMVCDKHAREITKKDVVSIQKNQLQAQ